MVAEYRLRAFADRGRELLQGQYREAERRRRCSADGFFLPRGLLDGLECGPQGLSMGLWPSDLVSGWNRWMGARRSADGVDDTGAQRSRPIGDFPLFARGLMQRASCGERRRLKESLSFAASSRAFLLDAVLRFSYRYGVDRAHGEMPWLDGFPTRAFCMRSASVSEKPHSTGDAGFG